jgi:cytochrome b subunit of formate dehydrogenase
MSDRLPGRKLPACAAPPGRAACAPLSLAAGILAAALALLTAGPGLARAAAPTDAECLMCHGDRSAGRVFVDTTTVRASVHGRVACAACHRSVTSVPHEIPLPRVRCESCHAAAGGALAQSVHGAATAKREIRCDDCHGTHGVRKAAQVAPEGCRACHEQVSDEYRQSVHGVALAHGDSEASTCTGCHGALHSARPHDDPASPVSRARLAETCGRCHADRELMIRRKIAIPEAYQLFRRSVHGRSSRPDAATCNDCHESHRLRRANDPGSSIFKTNIPATCGRCHAEVARKYAIGIHGTAVARGVTAAPVCTDCHGEHLIRGPADPESPVAAAQVSETCSRCHEAQGIRETYGLPAGRLSTWRDSFHGLAARGGSPAVANCASCHGQHDILPSSDPRSAINAANLPHTCGRCHPGAGTRFAMGPVHVAMTTPDQPLLYWVRIAYLWLIALVIGGMVLHNGLDFVAKARRHWLEQLGRLEARRETAARWLERMTLGERLQHGALAVSFFVLVYTGFALKFPEAWPFAWFARLEHGYRWRSVIHRGAAVVMVVTSLLHLGYLVTKRGRGMLAAMAPRARDFGEALGNVLFLLGLRSHPPRFDRFGYIEKAEYWALVWGTFIMTATGLVLWFENQSLQVLSKQALDLATVIHYYEAWLAFLAIVIWHLYQNILNPDVYPMNWTWITGRIPEERLRHEHPAEWARIAAAEAAEAEAPEDGGAEREAGPGDGTTPEPGAAPDERNP